MDFENEAMEKQREELRLLIAELRDRDRELNEMVATHQQQMDAWQHDRHRVISLEEKCSQLQSQFCVIIIIIIYIKFLSNLGNKICTSSGEDKETSFLFQHISVLVQLFISVLLHDSFIKDGPESGPITFQT